MSERARIVVVDDERSLREMIALHLTHRGFHVDQAHDGLAALEVVRRNAPDAIVLDIVMPRLGGLEAIPHLRRLTQAPILLLSARDDVETRVAGLSHGADDYVPKPFAIEELVARIRAALRRPGLVQPETLAVERLEIDLAARSARYAGREIELSAQEFRLLVALVRNRNRVLSREQLLDLAWHRDAAVTPGAAERCVSHLRAKLNAVSVRPIVKTVRGLGYVIRG